MEIVANSDLPRDFLFEARGIPHVRDSSLLVAPAECELVEIVAYRVVSRQTVGDRNRNGVDSWYRLKGLPTGYCVGEHFAIREFQGAARCYASGKSGDSDLRAAQTLRYE